MPRIEHSNWEEAVSPYVGQRERAVTTLVVMAGSRFDQRRLSARSPGGAVHRPYRGAAGTLGG
jgi:hypothetical protein